MKLIPLPALTDNYIWMLQDGVHAIVVDPGEAEPVFDALARDNLQLAAILVTHHHADHTGGVPALRDATGATVFGPARERIAQPYVALSQGGHAETLGLRFEVIDIPGHTAGHIAFFLPGTPDRQSLVFCGDTLFSGGCGRLFEGTPAQMLASLDALAMLPDDTRVCCGHEYTLANLRFARAVEPRNAALTQYMAQCEALRADDRPTLPSQLGIERRINPFLRSREADVRQALHAQAGLPADAGEVEAFAALRQWKNEFR